LHDVSRSVARRFDVRFARELRAGASFHILSGAIALDDRSVRLGHRVVDSANGEVTAWVEETLDITAASLPREIHDAVSRRLLPWEGPPVERRPEPTTVEGFVPTMRSRVRPTDLDSDGKFSLAAFVHRFTAACLQALAAIGGTSS
jgi:acyl-CoA thioesterase FadM